jgi:hypothetical protein
MKITKQRLKEIITEEITNVFNESWGQRKKAKDFITNPRIHPSIPLWGLGEALKGNEKLVMAAVNPANPQGQQLAFKRIGDLMGNIVEPNFKNKLKDVMDIAGYLQYAEEEGMFQKYFLK